MESIELATGTVPVRPIPWAQMVLGPVTGLLVGSGAAVAWERLVGGRGAESATAEAEPLTGEEADSVLLPRDEVLLPGSGEDATVPVATRPVQRVVAPVPNLAVIPEVRPSLIEPALNGDFRPGPLQLAGIEAYRNLRANLVSEWWGLKTLVVTSAHPGQGKTTTSTNLAATYARQGIKECWWNAISPALAGALFRDHP